MRATGITGWRAYYGVETEDDLQVAWKVDEHVAELLGLPIGALVQGKIGLRWCRLETPPVSSNRRLRGMEQFFPDTMAETLEERTWFASGDPWTVLLGVGDSDLLVGTLSLYLGGMLGPPNVTLETVIGRVALPLLKPRDLATVIATADKETRRRISRCPLCREQRYQDGCRCDGYAMGVNFD